MHYTSIAQYEDLRPPMCSYTAEKKKREEEERLQREKEGKPEKKKRAPRRKKNLNLSASTAEEAIEKMLQEKRISTKINYEVLNKITGAEVKQEVKPDVKRDVKPDISELLQPTSRLVTAELGLAE